VVVRAAAAPTAARRPRPPVTDAGIAGARPRAEEARLPLPRPDDRLRVHAGSRGLVDDHVDGCVVPMAA
jgi:hypothetical protein